MVLHGSGQSSRFPLERPYSIKPNRLMRNAAQTSARVLIAGTLVSAALLASSVQARVLDDFNDNTKTGWEDFTFVPGFGIAQETGGELRFDLPPAGQAIFTSAQLKTEVFTLRDGRTVEFRVDVTKAGGEFSYPVLAFIPGSPSELAGYSLSQSATDVLIAKGIEKYFIDDDGPTAKIKHENVTLLLRLTGRGNSVEITGRVLDKDDDNAVLWDRTFMDTPAADVMGTGTDDPPEPYLGTGYFTLYCYQNFDAGSPEPTYVAHFDNAQVVVMDETVLDDFNDNTKSDWSDFTFIPGFGLPSETGGQFVFDQPGVGQDIFSASQKVSRNIELVEGERIEMRVDVIESTGEDTFPVLAFIPNTGGNEPSTLAGYGLAKDPDDVLITKGILKYFVADDGVTAELKNENITLSLALEVENGSVIVTGRILDKDDNNAVLWERTVVDTPAEDPMTDGTDDPAAPYITTGYFTLYCYQQSNAGVSQYRIAYDNAVLIAPPLAANTAPIISEVQPANYANFLPADSVVSFKVADDKPLPKEKVTLTLNGAAPAAGTVEVTNVTPDGSEVRYTLTGGLEVSQNYVVVLRAEDSEGSVTTQTVYYDTFATTDRVVEVEDYNFFGGNYINDPQPWPEGWWNDDAYTEHAGFESIDFHDTRTAPAGEDTPYRSSDPVRMQHTLDVARQKFVDAGGAGVDIYDYDVGDIAASEWLQYTRSFTPGSYVVYLRQSVVNMSTGDSVLERVTGDPGTPDAAATPLGTFFGKKSGFQYRNFPLTDGTGQNNIVLQLSGVTTLRLRQVTADPGDGGRYQNYLVFVQVPPPGTQRAAIVLLKPAPDAEARTVEPAIEVEIFNRDTSVKSDTIQLELNGVQVAAQVDPLATGARVSYLMVPLPPSGVTQNARVTYRDSEDVELSTTWSFKVIYSELDPATARTGPGIDRGIRVRVVQAPQGSGLESSLVRAENQLAPNSTIPKFYDTTVVDQVINYSQNAPGSSDGTFPNDALIPGLDKVANGDDDIAMEATAWLELAAGIHRFGAHTDDGFKVVGGTLVNEPSIPALSFRSGGTANQTFEFVVPVSGLYPFRFVWYERGGGAHAEWFSVNRTTDQRILINGGDAGATKAYLDAENVVLDVLEYADQLGGGFQEDPGASLNGDTFTTSQGGAARFYRIRSTSAHTIQDIQAQGEQVTIRFQ